MATTILTGAENGTTVHCRVADEIVVRLPENPTTGFRWQVATIDGPIEAAGDDFELTPPVAIGSGGTREIRFRALNTGIAAFSLVHGQPWEGEGSVDKRFAVSVEIAD